MPRGCEELGKECGFACGSGGISCKTTRGNAAVRKLRQSKTPRSHRELGWNNHDCIQYATYRAADFVNRGSAKVITAESSHIELDPTAKRMSWYIRTGGVWLNTNHRNERTQSAVVRHGASGGAAKRVQSSEILSVGRLLCCKTANHRTANGQTTAQSVLRPVFRLMRMTIRWETALTKQFTPLFLQAR